MTSPVLPLKPPLPEAVPIPSFIKRREPKRPPDLTPFLLRIFPDLATDKTITTPFGLPELVKRK